MKAYEVTLGMIVRVNGKLGRVEGALRADIGQMMWWITFEDKTRAMHPANVMTNASDWVL